MVKNLLKTPLTAILYAALLYFIVALLPWSESFLEAMDGFTIPIWDYLLSIVHGLVISLIIILLYTNSRKKGVKLLIFSALPLLGYQWLLPLFRQIMRGEATGVMAQADTLLYLLAGCLTGIFILVLLFLLFSPTANKPETPNKAAKPAKPNEAATPANEPPKYRMKKLGLLIRIVVLPIIFCILYFLLTYYLLWHVEAVRAYYGGAEDGGFITEMINLLLTDAGLVPLALLNGLLCTLLGLSLMIHLIEKRIVYILMNAMLSASGALLLLTSTPLMESTVRMQHMVAYLAIYVPFSAFAAFLLHTAAVKVVEEAPATPDTGKAAGAAKPGVKPGVKPAVKPAAARR